MASHTVYAVASGKGGVGKTATTVNLGASLAEAGYTVAIVDTDLGMANLGGFIGVEPEETLHEVLAGDATLEEATYEALNGLAVVPSGISLNGFANVETAALSDAVGALEEAFDYVLLDLGAGLSHDTVLPLALADAVVLVSTPQPVSVQDTAKTRQITERLGGRVAGVVLTRAGSPGDLELDEISDTLELPVLAVIPEDDAVPASARQEQAVLQYAPDSPVVEGYRGLAGIIEEESLADAPVVPEMPEPEPEPTTGSEPEPEPGPASESEPAPEPESEVEPAADAGVEPEPEPEADPEETPADAAGEPEATAGADAATAEPPTDVAAGEEATGTGQAPGEAAVPDDDPADPADDAETTAAEIAAAIEDAASEPAGGGQDDAADAGADGSEPATANGRGGGTSVEPDAAPARDAGVDADPVDASTDDDGDEPADADEGEPDRLSVESTADPDSEEGEAVDQLFSVEGADPEELDDEDEEESGGLFRRFLG